MADEAQRRRQQHILSLQTTRLTEAPSMGEILLPFLFAAMETCWIDAIFVGLASIGLFASHDPLMPLWAPFVIIIGSQWILSRLELRDARSASEAEAGEKDEVENAKGTIPGASIFIAFVSVVTLFVIWISVYAQQAFFLDPRWLLSLLNDVLLLNLHAYHVFFIVGIIAYLCWCGARLLHREYEPSHVFSTLRLGVCIIIGVILVSAGQARTGAAFNEDVTLLLIMPIFLFLSLAAHALARVTFVRHMHALGTEEDVSPHERAILVTIGGVGIVLLITAWIVDVLASPAILTDIQQMFNVLGQVYDWFISIVALVCVFLATPLFWLFEWWTTLFPPKLPPTVTGKPRARLLNHVPPHTQQIAAVVPFVKILLPILLIVFAVLLVRWIVRHRRRVRLATNRRVVELHESLWSWQLFWSQLKALLLALFGRFRQASQEEQVVAEAIQGEPGVRNIREIYRALLKRAAARGYPRKKNETPYEFEQRLDEQTPLAQPHIAVVTEAYTAIRYGGMVPDEAEVARVRQEWTQLEQKWREARM
ncbi:MAG: DUF4129 domain-containing protein [Ktedonobacteraceae bacterium]